MNKLLHVTWMRDGEWRTNDPVVVCEDCWKAKFEAMDCAAIVQGESDKPCEYEGCQHLPTRIVATKGEGK